MVVVRLCWILLIPRTPLVGYRTSKEENRDRQQIYRKKRGDRLRERVQMDRLKLDLWSKTESSKNWLRRIHRLPQGRLASIWVSCSPRVVVSHMYLLVVAPFSGGVFVLRHRLLPHSHGQRQASLAGMGRLRVVAGSHGLKALRKLVR